MLICRNFKALEYTSVAVWAALFPYLGDHIGSVKKQKQINKKGITRSVYEDGFSGGAKKTCII